IRTSGLLHTDRHAKTSFRFPATNCRAVHARYTAASPATERISHALYGSHPKQSRSVPFLYWLNQHMNNKIENIVFDLGGVLIDWNPRYLYRKIFKTEEEVTWFLENICTAEWNDEQDAGRSFEEATQ